MLLGDVDGALASFDWYVDAFPDDGGEPYQYLTWALALFRGGRRPEAVRTLCHTMPLNVYLVPASSATIPVDWTSGTAVTGNGRSTRPRSRRRC